MTAKKGFVYVLIAYVVFVFIQSLFFKFTGSEETELIFSTIAQWMSDVGLGFIAPSFESFGGYIIGGIELIASALLIIPFTRKLGASIGFVIISGALFFHLGTPLGVNRVINDAGDTDGGVLFFMACGVWLSCILLFVLSSKVKH